MQNTSLVQEIKHTEELNDMRKSLSKLSKLKSIQNECPLPYECDTSIEKAVQDYFRRMNFGNEEIDAQITSLNHELIPAHLYGSLFNNKTMDILDLTLTFAQNHEDCAELVKVYENHFRTNPNEEATYHKTFMRIKSIFDEYAHEKKLSFCDILLDPLYSLDVAFQKKEDDMYNLLVEQYDLFTLQLSTNETGILNANHPAHRTFFKLQEVSLALMKLNYHTEDGKEIFKYLQRLFYYLKAFSKIFYIESNNSTLLSQGRNVSYFHVLNLSRHELVGKLVFNRNMLPSELEAFFGKMKLDLCYNVAANCFPITYFDSDDESNLLKPLQKPSKDILTYIQKRNWLLGFIINEIHKVEERNVDPNDSRVQHIFNYVKLPSVQTLKEVFNDNEFLALLQHRISVRLIENYFTETIKKYDLDELRTAQFSELSTESCEEVSEGFLRTTNWKHLLDVVESVPQLQLKETPILQDLRDSVLCNLVAERYEPEYYRFVNHIRSDELRLNLILSDMVHWPGNFCVDLIRAHLSRFDGLGEEHRPVLKDWEEKIKLYEQVGQLMQPKFISAKKVIFLC